MSAPALNHDDDEAVRATVRDRYAAAARSVPLSPAAGESGCCASAPLPGADPITADLYDASQTPFEDALAASLGCGNPTALAELTPGQDVLDLGSGGGLDVLLSARRVAPGGTAYGLDMTDEMLALARAHQKRAGVTNATFLKGHIEAIPLPDASVDVVISNCVINLSPDKDAVLAEAHRVLRPAGRFAVSDIVLLRDIPAELRQVVGLWTGCIAGALRDTEYVAKLGAAGFADAGVEITRRYERADLEAMADGLDPAGLPESFDRAAAIEALDGAFAAAFVRATKPAAG